MQTKDYYCLSKYISEDNDDVAIIYNCKTITYKQLFYSIQNFINSINQDLIRNKKVIILCTRTPECIVGILSVIWLGGTFILIDDSCPRKKLSFIISDSKADLILKSELSPQIKTDIEQIHLAFNSHPSRLKINSIEKNSSEYIYEVYTSGTTGDPKGVSINHSGFYNLIHWYINYFKIDRSCRNLLLTSFGFDASVKNIIIPFLTGSVLVLVECELFDINRISLSICRDKVSLVNCIPSLFESILQNDKINNYKKLKSLKEVILGGETLNSTIFNNWTKSEFFNANVTNVYGPTEGTDLTTYYRLKPDDFSSGQMIPIGTPLPNKRILILDKSLQKVSIKEKGILYIGGMGVIKTYSNPENNHGKFIEFFIENEKKQFYKTDDIVSLNDNKVLQFHGRADNQIKINGQRVELEEIERIIKSNNQIKHAIVRLEEISGKKILIAYISTKNTHDYFDQKELINFCKSWLPDAWIPNKFQLVKEFQKNTSGKIIRNQEFKYEQTNVRNIKEFDDEDELLRVVLESWEQTLENEIVDIHKPFYELGGNSLLLHKLSAAIEHNTKYEISVIDLLEYTTIHQQNEFLKNKLNVSK